MLSLVPSESCEMLTQGWSSEEIKCLKQSEECKGEVMGGKGGAGTGARMDIPGKGTSRKAPACKSWEQETGKRSAPASEATCSSDPPGFVLPIFG